jgi:hypothetical protein
MCENCRRGEIFYKVFTDFYKVFTKAQQILTGVFYKKLQLKR